MGILIAVVAAIVLLLYIVHIPGVVRGGSGSSLLSLYVAVAVIIFASVSLAAVAGLIETATSFHQGILLAALVVMAILVRVSSASKPAA